VTYLFALAKNNGTVDWIVHGSVRAVGGRVALVPWAMFVVCAIVTAIGAVSPAAVAIVAPVAMGFAVRYQIHPVMMGMMVVQGATAGSFSPIGIFGSITNGVVESNDLPGSQTFLFFSTFLAATAIAVVTYVAFGGRALIARGREDVTVAAMGVEAEHASYAATRAGGSAGAPHSAVEARRSATPAGGAADDPSVLNLQRGVTLLGLVALMVGALGFDLDVGFTALTIAVALTLDVHGPQQPGELVVDRADARDAVQGYVDAGVDAVTHLQRLLAQQVRAHAVGREHPQHPHQAPDAHHQQRDAQGRPPAAEHDVEHHDLDGGAEDPQPEHRRDEP
jgi:hypothetical protein